MHHLRTRVAIAIFSGLALGSIGNRAAGFTPTSNPPQLTDENLLDYAAQSYDKRAKMNTQEVLGIHRGNRVIVEFPCSDVCPDYTVRVIHYDVAPTLRCSDTGGVTKTIWVPVSIARMKRDFCFPKPIADNWENYRQ